MLRVGVFVNASPATIAEAVETAGLHVVQLHGDEGPNHFMGTKVWKAFKVSDEWNPAMLDRYPAEAFLLDGPRPGEGQAFDWTMARALPHRIILAGGLGPDNIAAAIETAQPWGVDACSRLEKAPGQKDHQSMRRFLEAALKESFT